MSKHVEDKCKKNVYSQYSKFQKGYNAGGLSREYVLRIPGVSLKAT